MSIKIAAMAPEDGWAFVIVDDRILLLRPPYDVATLKEATWQVVENAIDRYGFEAFDLTFADLDEVIDFVKRTYVERKEKRGVAVPTSAELSELVTWASDEVLTSYIVRVESQLIPQKRLEAARRVISALVSSRRVTGNSAMLDRVAKLLEMCVLKEGEEERLLEEIALDPTTGWSSKYSMASHACSPHSIVAYQEKVSRRGTLVPL